MFKRLANKRGLVLPIVMLFLIVLIILIVALTYISYGRFLASIHSYKNDYVLTSALNLAYYDLFTGRYKGGSTYASAYYQQGWQSSGGSYSVEYKIPVALDPNVTGGDCSAHSLTGGNNCIGEADFDKYIPVRVVYDPSASPQITISMLSRKEVDY